jgi:hypothetical protein
MSAMIVIHQEICFTQFVSQPATQNLDISSTSEDSVEEDLAAELQKSISNVFKHAAQKQKIWKKSRQRLKLFSLLPPVASEHFRLQGLLHQGQKFLAV